MLLAWCHSHSNVYAAENNEYNMTTFDTYAVFTPLAFERILLCVLHISISIIGCILCLPILIYAKNNAAAARFKLVNNFVVYVCIVSLLFSVLQLGFGIR